MHDVHNPLYQRQLEGMGKLGECATKGSVEFLFHHIDLLRRDPLGIALNALGQQEIMLEPGAYESDWLKAHPQVGVLLHLDNANISHIALDDCPVFSLCELSGASRSIRADQEHHLSRGRRGFDKAAYES